MRNNKKKGFTLIELIAVIAILAILGAILVPNVLGYRKRAQKSNIQTSAKTILSAVEAYNSDKDLNADKIGDGSTDYPGTIPYYLATPSDATPSGLYLLNKDETIVLTKTPTCLKDGVAFTKVSDLKNIADGHFAVDKVSGQDSTILSGSITTR